VDSSSKNASGSSSNTLPPEVLDRLRDRARLLLGTPPSAAAAPKLEAAAPAVVPANANDPTQRRGAERRKTLLTGKVVFNDMASVFDCVVRDMSETGARLKLAAPVQVPPVFGLRLTDGRYYRCKVRRRAALELGVEFLD
jgi:hypothetical protein